MPLKVLILLGAGFISVFLFVRIYPFLHLSLIKILNGRYCEKYIRFYTKYIGESPFRSCIKGEFFLALFGFYKPDENVEMFNTKSSITFGSFDYGINSTHLLKLRDKPVCVNADKLNSFNLLILGFRDKLFDFDIKAIHYFADNCFFMGEYLIEITDETKIDEISHILQKKYFDKIKTSSHKYLIEGSNKVLIGFEFNGFKLSIKYLNKADLTINEKLDNYWNSKMRSNINQSQPLERGVIDKIL